MKIWNAPFLLLMILSACGEHIPNASQPPADPNDFSPQDVVETMFLDRGLLRSPGDPCTILTNLGTWSTFPQGATILVRLAPEIPNPHRTAILRAVNDLNATVEGFFTLRLQDGPLQTGPFTISIDIVNALAVGNLCGTHAGGCAHVLDRQGATLKGVQTVQGTDAIPAVYVHELGHAIGLCHLNSRILPGVSMADVAILSRLPDRFTRIELDAIRSVFASGLTPGATDQDFRRLGLIR